MAPILRALATTAIALLVLNASPGVSHAADGAATASVAGPEQESTTDGAEPDDGGLDDAQLYDVQLFDAAPFPAEPFAATLSEVATSASHVLRDRPSETSARVRIGRVRDGRAVLGGLTIDTPSSGRLDWADSSRRGRSHQRLVHGLLIVRDLAALAAAGDPDAAPLAMAIVDDWRRANPRSAPAGVMAWHDETTAQRVLSLLDLHEVLQGEERARVASMLTNHVAVLLEPGFHATGNNHGMFQDRAILAWTASDAASDAASDTASASLATTARATASRRLLDYFNDVVAPDGVHLEHSPAYHQVILGNINRIAAFYRLVGDTGTAATYAGIQRSMTSYATHVLQPDGTFPLVGDTMVDNVPSARLADSSGYRYAVTGGREGVALEATDGFFPDGGYAVMRDSWSSGVAGTYLHFAASYHGSYHKHADDLSLWLYHGGELLTEAGPNGYEYTDPFTAYGYGASSHNGVLVDGVGVSRNDGRFDAVGLDLTSRSGAVSQASGFTWRLPSANWRRGVRYDRDAQQVTVTDRLRSRSTARDFSVLWHTAPGVSTHRATDGSIDLARNGVTVARMRVSVAGSPLAVTSSRGASNVSAGWRLGGGTPRPVTTLRFAVPRSSTATVLTDIELLAAPRAPVDVMSVCQGQPVVPTFTDVSGTHAAAIACAAGLGITEGRTATSFAPDRALTRAQLTALLVRTLEGAGTQLPATDTRSTFADVTGTHAEAVRRAASAGLVAGTSADTFDPDVPVTRGQMATLLVRAYELAGGLLDPPGPGRFVDVTGGTHATGIDQAAALGLTAGNGTTGYGPNEPLSRAQTATLVLRLRALITA